MFQASKLLKDRYLTLVSFLKCLCKFHIFLELVSGFAWVNISLHTLQCKTNSALAYEKQSHQAMGSISTWAIYLDFGSNILNKEHSAHKADIFFQESNATFLQAARVKRLTLKPHKMLMVVEHFILWVCFIAHQSQASVHLLRANQAAAFCTDVVVSQT